MTPRSSEDEADSYGKRPDARKRPEQRRFPAAARPAHTFTANSSGCMVPSATLLTVPVIMIEKPSPMEMPIVPPGTRGFLIQRSTS